MEQAPHRTRTRATITDGRQGPTSDSENVIDASTSTITSAVIVNVVRDRSGTIVARSTWDETALTTPARNTPQHHTHTTLRGLLNDSQPQQASLEYRGNTPSPSASTDTSRAETETEDEPEQDADGDINMNRVSRSRIANRSSSTVTSRRGDPRLHINATLHAGQRHQQNSVVYPHNHVLSPGSTPASASASPSPERTAIAGMRNAARQPRFGPLGDRAAALAGVGINVGRDADAHIIISDAVGVAGVVGENLNMAMGVGVEGVGVAGVEDGMESLQANDDFAMGAPPGAPGAIVLDTPSVGMEESAEGTTPRSLLGGDEGRRMGAGVSLLDSNSTPRAGVVDLPDMSRQEGPLSAGGLQRDTTVRARRASAGEGSASLLSAATSTSRAAAYDAESVASGSGNGMVVDADIQPQNTQRPVSAPEMAAATSTASTATNASANAVNGSASAGAASMLPPGPYKDEDVLLGLQLLAYLSKYPHVRQAFYKPRASFHPASLGLHQTSTTRQTEMGMLSAREREKQRETIMPVSGTGLTVNTNQGFFRALAGRGRAALNSACLGGAHVGARATGPAPSSAAATMPAPNPQPRQTNVFSLVERFTFKPSSNEADLPNPPPRLPAEIQYWAGVIMRNACRKDDSRGGIRQCANSKREFLSLVMDSKLMDYTVLCGRWEQYPREFAKCRRCRKAKYCGKECQSTAWSEGHRFWCSARDADEDGGDKERGGDHRPDTAHPTQPQVAHHHMQIMDEAGEMRLIPNGDGPILHGLGAANQVSPRAERAARRERERERRLRDPGNDIGQRPPGFTIDPMYVPVSIARRAAAAQAPHTQQVQSIVPISPTEAHQRAGPVAGPSNAAGIMMTEAAAQQQQRLQDHRGIVDSDSDWLYVTAPRPQTEAGPSRNSWDTDVVSDVISGDESDMILG